MLPDETVEAALDVFQTRVDKVKAKYLRLVGEHIAAIGKIGSSDLQRIEQLRKMETNMITIEAELAAALRIDIKDARALLQASAKSVYGDAADWYDQTAFGKNPAMRSILTAQVAQTEGTLVNLSRTKLTSTAYQTAIDDAITAVQTGVTNYTGAIESSLREVADEGLRVRYPSGITRRIDTAVRQNILEGVRQTNQRIADAVGQEFEADGVEISAHMDCAEDHLDIQGKQYTLEEFDRLQSTLERPIGMYNCRHFAFPVIIGISEPAQSEEQLQTLNEQSSKTVTIDGETRTRYEWTQEQRRLETAVRYQKDAANIAHAAGDGTMEAQAQQQITALRKQYRKVSKAAEIPTQYDRMKVAGFTRR